LGFGVRKGGVDNVDKLKKCPNNFETTTPYMKYEYDRWGNKVVYKEFVNNIK